MKHLLLLRHAKSAWGDPSLADIDRPLAARGRKAAPQMGRELATRGWAPQTVLVSPARRARETWELVAAKLSEPPAAAFLRELYMASEEQLLATLRQTSRKTATLLMIGHNPGLEELARRLADTQSEATALAHLNEKFPTAALVRFKFDGEWAELGFGGALLTHFLRPRDLE